MKMKVNVMIEKLLICLISITLGISIALLFLVEKVPAGTSWKLELKRIEGPANCEGQRSKESDNVEG